MVGESWDVFTKRVLVEKYFNGSLSCVKIQGDHGPLLHPLPTSMTIIKYLSSLCYTTNFEIVYALF